MISIGSTNDAKRVTIRPTDAYNSDETYWAEEKKRTTIIPYLVGLTTQIDSIRKEVRMVLSAYPMTQQRLDLPEESFPFLQLHLTVSMDRQVEKTMLTADGIRKHGRSAKSKSTGSRPPCCATTSVINIGVQRVVRVVE